MVKIRIIKMKTKIRTKVKIKTNRKVNNEKVPDIVHCPRINAVITISFMAPELGFVKNLRPVLGKTR